MITYEKSLRTAKYAFEFALLNNRKKVGMCAGDDRRRCATSKYGHPEHALLWCHAQEDTAQGV